MNIPIIIRLISIYPPPTVYRVQARRDPPPAQVNLLISHHYAVLLTTKVNAVSPAVPCTERMQTRALAVPSKVTAVVVRA